MRSFYLHVPHVDLLRRLLRQRLGMYREMDDLRSPSMFAHQTLTRDSRRSVCNIVNRRTVIRL